VKKKAILGFLAVFFSCLAGWAQDTEARPYWFTLERGKLYFRNGAYGDALLSFEDARMQRKDMYTRMEQDLIDLLSLPEVRRLGDSLDLVETYISERNRPNAARALEELYYRVPREDLRGSARTALEQLGRLKDYPEAEYWIGEIYRVEGELGIALRQYERAYGLRALLEIPGFEVELLYKIVGIHRVRQEYIEMEQRLLEIIEGNSREGSPRDSLWTAGSGTFTMNAMLRILENDGVNRFLTIYRYNNTVVERAHRLLGFFYYASGRHSRAVEHLLFAFLIQNTIFIEEILRNQFDFTFTTLDALMRETARRPALAAYIEEVEYYRTIYYLGAALYGSGKLPPAREFWNFLYRHPAAGEWNGRAAAQLRSPFVEKVQEMP
jgi:tetratricopeptide (TPR) repeat protein